jgi:hypothetical protein
MGTREALASSEKRLMEKQDSSQSPAPGNDKDIRRTAKIILAIILLVGVSVASYQVMKEIFPHNRMSRYPARDWISLKGGNEIDAVPSGKQENRQDIRIAIAPVFSPEKSMEMYAPFVTFVAGKLGIGRPIRKQMTLSAINGAISPSWAHILL